MKDAAQVRSKNKFRIPKISKKFMRYQKKRCFYNSSLMIAYDQYISGGSDGKECACNAQDPGLILGLGRCPGEGNGNPFQYSCLENPMDRKAWRAMFMGSQIVRHN